MATRRERVLLELEDSFTTGMARAAAATAVLNRELNSLSGSSVETSRDSDRLQRSLGSVGAQATKTSRAFGDGSSEIDKYSGRLGLLVRTAAALGPALVPIGAAGIPAIAGLTMGFGAAASAAGVALLAFSGMGDALKSLGEYKADPTAAHLAKMREEMDKIGPSAEHFVRYLDSIAPQLSAIRETARAGMFPGVERGIDELLGRLPEVRRLIFDISTELGRLSTSAGHALSGSGFDAFFHYLKTDAVPTLHAFATATGNVIEGLANMLVAFAPLSRDFTGGMVEMTQAFADWSAGLNDNAGFQEFLSYLQATGPQVVDLIGQIALTLASVVEAAAPVGQLTLPVLQSLAHIIETIADSDLGTPLLAGVAAMSALRLATQAWSKIAQTSVASFVASQGRAVGAITQVTTAQQRATMSVRELAAAERSRVATSLGGAARLTAVMAGLALASTDAGDSLGATNAASMALMGSYAGGWGAAIGGAIGLTMDFAAANDDLEGSMRRVDSAIKSMDTSEIQASLEDLNAQIDAFHEKTTVESSWNPIALSKEKLDAVIAGVSDLATGVSDSAEAKREDAKAALEDSQAHDRYMASGIGAARVARQTKTQVEGLTAAMRENTSETLAAFDAETRWRQALKDAMAQAKKSSAGIRGNSDEVLKNRDLLSQLAGAWNNQSEAVKNNVGRWKEARSQFIKAATDMKVPIEKAKALADGMLQIPKSVVIKTEAKTDPAIAAALRLKHTIESIPREWQTNYRINVMQSIVKPELHGPHAADGMTVPGQRHPYGDKLLAWVAPGEEIISNRHGEADRFRADRAAGRIPAYANGGTAYATAGAGGTPSFAFVGPAAAAANALGSLANASTKELKIRARLLDKEIERDQKAVDLAKQHRDAVLEDIKSLKQSVADRFKSQLFGLQGPGFQAPQLSLPSNFNDLSPAEQAAAIRQMNQQQADLDATYAHINEFQTQSPVDVLKADIARQREARRLYRQLRAAGLHGSALAYAQQNASNEELAALLGDPQMLKQYQHLYGVREKGANQLGQTAAMQRFGGELAKANKIWADAKDTLHRIEAAEKRVEAAIKHQTRENKKNSDDNAHKTTAGINGAAARASRKGSAWS